MSCGVFFITGILSFFERRVSHKTALFIKNSKRNNFIPHTSGAILFPNSCPPIYAPLPPDAIQFRAEQPYVRQYTPLCICVRALHAGGPSLVPDTREFAGMGVGNGVGEGGREGRGAHAAALIFNPRYATANYSAYMLAHCESVERWRSITASEVEPLCQFA